MPRLRTQLALVAVPLMLAACGGSDPSPGVDLSAADVVVVADDVEFVDPRTKMPGGGVRIGLDNRGQVRHDVTFEGDPGTVADAPGGGQDVGAEVMLEPGTYTVYCAVPGHRQAGMEFEVTVQ